MRILTTIKTYPIPSVKYDELVCTAGILENGDFVRLYPINFRDLPYDQQYKKYQWIEVDVVKHAGRDARKESYRPRCETLQIIGEPIPTHNGDWAERSKYVLRQRSASLEELQAKQAEDRTSLGIFKPKVITDLVIEPDDPEWKPQFKAALAQARLWENRTASKEPPRKVPYRFRYQFSCEDTRCKANHEIMIEDWEVGALFWNLRDRGASPQEAAQKVKHKFLNELCGPDRDTHFYVGTHSIYPTWMVIGVYYPKTLKTPPPEKHRPTLFD
jgi:hypothetical protein